jgi:hypothetical protein
LGHSKNLFSNILQNSGRAHHQGARHGGAADAGAAAAEHQRGTSGAGGRTTRSAWPTTSTRRCRPGRQEGGGRERDEHGHAAGSGAVLPNATSDDRLVVGEGSGGMSECAAGSAAAFRVAASDNRL